MKSVRDLGHIIEALKPLKLPRHEAGQLPDPGSHTDCLIIVNDRADGTPRARLALSNGASWDYFALVHELASTAQHVDVVPLVRQAVMDTLPALMQPQQAQALIAPARAVDHAPLNDARFTAIDDNRREMADVMLEMAGTITDLMHRVHHLENNALDVQSQISTKERAA